MTYAKIGVMCPEDEGRDMDQEMQVASKSWKRLGKILP